MEKDRINEGKTKIVYSSDRSDAYLLKFKDDITALDGEKHDLLEGKGKINATISVKLFELLEKNGIKTHLIEPLDSNSILVRKLKMMPLEVVCRNIAAGHFLSRFSMFKKGQKLKFPIVEFYLKDDALHDPMLVEDHLVLLDLASEDEVAEMKEITRRVNKVLFDFFLNKNLKLVDFKLEFGRDSKNQIILGDELNSDCMRLWDIDTGEILDKDVYRQNSSMNEVKETYEELYRRLFPDDKSM